MPKSNKKNLSKKELHSLSSKNFQVYFLVVLVGFILAFVFAIQNNTFDLRRNAQTPYDEVLPKQCFELSVDECRDNSRCSWGGNGCTASALNCDHSTQALCNEDNECSWKDGKCSGKTAAFCTQCFGGSDNEGRPLAPVSVGNYVPGVDGCKQCAQINAEYCGFRPVNATFCENIPAPAVFDFNSCTICKNGVNTSDQVVETPLGGYLEGKEGWYQCQRRGENLCTYQRINPVDHGIDTSPQPVIPEDQWCGVCENGTDKDGNRNISKNVGERLQGADGCYECKRRTTLIECSYTRSGDVCAFGPEVATGESNGIFDTPLSILRFLIGI